MNTREMIDIDRKITMLSTQVMRISDKMVLAIYLIEKAQKIQREAEQLLREKGE